MLKMHSRNSKDILGQAWNAVGCKVICIVGHTQECTRCE